jgi:hypothetical protein
MSAMSKLWEMLHSVRSWRFENVLVYGVTRDGKNSGEYSAVSDLRVMSSERCSNALVYTPHMELFDQQQPTNH